MPTNVMLFSNLGNFILWCVCGAFCTWFFFTPGIGHRRDLLVGSVFFYLRTASSLCTLWDYIHNLSRHSGVPVQWLSGIATYAMIVYIVTSYAPVLLMLLEAGYFEHVRKEKPLNQESMSRMLILSAKTNRVTAASIQARWESRGSVQ